jgi:feruloyl esterase
MQARGFFVRRDPAFNSLALAPVNPGPWQVRITELAGIQSADPDKLAAFRAKGGKVLMAHGKHDPLVSNRTTQDFARQLEAKMGDSGDFLRYYEIPGYGHAVSTAFNASWDSLTALERWVEEGNRTRPSGGRRHRRCAGTHPSSLRISGLAPLQRQR